MPLNTQTDVTADSSTVNPDTTPSRPGQSASKASEAELLANAKAENQRKQERIDSLTEHQEQMESKIAELSERVAAGEATRTEQAQLAQLQDSSHDIETQLLLLENDPKNKLGYLSIDRRIEKRVNEAIAKGEHNALYRLQTGFLEDAAEENGLDYEKFVRAIRPFADTYQHENVYRKAVLAVRAWKKAEETKKRDAETKAKEAEAARIQETGTREARNPSPSDTPGRKYKPGNFGDEMKSLGL